MSGTIFSLLPPFLTIVMVLLTKRVILSLAVGIITSGFLINQFSIADSVQTIIRAFITIFYAEGSINTWNVFILLFLLLLGIITAFITMTGGSEAFAEWAMKRVKTRIGAQLLTIFLGILLFIDDYFNALAVGQICRPITDKQRISRAKLAYLIDSTSAPICVISPVSSWGAYIIGIIGTILATHEILQYSAFSAFIQMIPMNFYVITAFLFIFITIVFNINFGKMAVHEKYAITTGKLVINDESIPGELNANIPVSNRGKVIYLIAPILALFVGAIGSMFVTGSLGTEGKVTIISIFDNTDVSLSLLIGGIFGVIVALLLYLSLAKVDEHLSTRTMGIAFKEGIKSMLPSIYILTFAWWIVDLIGQLKTGEYLASLIEQFNVSSHWLPAVVFVVAGIMAFATGTSWGTFGVMLPIAAQIMVVVDLQLLLPVLAAVLAGAVFGDHCSPISDTTILSATGAGCHHIDHVITQLPYAVFSALITIVGYIVLGFTGSLMFGIITLFLLSFIFLFYMSRTRKYQVD